MQFFNGKAKNLKKAQKPVEPRTLDEITAEYSQANTKAGDYQYQIFILQNALKQINETLAGLSYEADARKKLDDAAKTAQESK